MKKKRNIAKDWCVGFNGQHGKGQHGGKREGAGRPKTKEPTKVMRVPLSLVPKVKQWIDNLNRK